EAAVTTEIEPSRPRLPRRPALGLAPIVRDVGFAVFGPSARRIEHRRLVHDAGGFALQPMIEPCEIGVARPEIAAIDEMMLVRADPQLLIADARLKVVERRDYAGLENVEPARDVEAGDLDRAAEIVGRPEGVRRRMRNDLVEKGLPRREIG